MKTTRPEDGLERLLAVLERDMLDAADDEILAAARELGMKPAMRGSAAFVGVTILARARTRLKSSAERKHAPLARRRPKGDAPST
jgi:hypothetical protein